MDAHERLMATLYEALREAGDGTSHTQIVRMAYAEIARLRDLNVPWKWIAARIARVSEKGIEDPVPPASEMTGAKVTALSATRAAFSRVARQMASIAGTGPRARAGPRAGQGTPHSPPQTLPSSPPSHSSNRRPSTNSYAEDLAKLRTPPP